MGRGLYVNFSGPSAVSRVMFKTTSLTLSAALVLASGIAAADGWHGAVSNAPLPPPPPPVAVAPSYGPPTAPPAGTYGPGHYELRTFERWVPGSTQQVWVPPSCPGQNTPGCAHTQFCVAGHYQAVQVAPRLETVRDWVWVTDFTIRHHQHRWGRR